MEELLAHIAAENAKTEAWVAEDPANRWAGLYPVEPAYWEGRGIRSVEELKRQNLLDFIYEETKDTFGYRPDMAQYKAMSLEELQDAADFLGEEISRELDRKRNLEAANFVVFENRIKEIQELTRNPSKEDALRILIEGEGETESVKFYGYESLEYTLNIAFGSIKKWLEE